MKPITCQVKLTIYMFPFTNQSSTHCFNTWLLLCFVYKVYYFTEYTILQFKNNLQRTAISLDAPFPRQKSFHHYYFDYIYFTPDAFFCTLQS